MECGEELVLRPPHVYVKTEHEEPTASTSQPPPPPPAHPALIYIKTEPFTEDEELSPPESSLLVDVKPCIKTELDSFHGVSVKVEPLEELPPEHCAPQELPPPPQREAQEPPRLNNHSDYDCQRCGAFGFTTEMGLKIHMTKVHKTDGVARAKVVVVEGRKLLECNVCKKTFPSRKKLRDHAACAHPAADRAAACPHCGKVFKTSINLKVHTRLVHPAAPPLPCNICRKTFKTAMLLQKHVAWTHAEDGRRYPCPHCPRVLNSTAAYGKHVENVHPPAGAVTRCPEEGCYKVFKSPFHLRQHHKRFHLKIRRTYKKRQADAAMEMQHAGEGIPMDCEDGQILEPAIRLVEGEAAEVQRREAEVQRREAEGVEGAGEQQRERYPCGICARVFASDGAREWHSTLEHPDGKAAHPCNLCMRMLPDRASLRRHVRSVHADGTEQHECTACGKTFKSLLSLRQHARVTHAPPHAAVACTECGKVLKCRAHLQVHMHMVHEEPGDHECRMCGKRFTRLKYLERHERSHADKTHECNVCRKLFKSEEDARRHERRVHSGQPPPPRHRCAVCERELSTVYTLRAHMTSVHGAACVECPHDGCRVGFPSQESLAAHEGLHYALQVKCEPPEAEE